MSYGDGNCFFRSMSLIFYSVQTPWGPDNYASRNPKSGEGKYLLPNWQWIKYHYSRGSGGKRAFVDDCGSWLKSSAPSIRNAYLLKEETNTYKLVYDRNGVICCEKQCKGVRQYIPYDPQRDPASFIYLYKHYTTIKANPHYKRRITWLDNATSKYALVKYAGKYPGRALTVTPRPKLEPMKIRKKSITRC